jgi:hypothetical protein
MDAGAAFREMAGLASATPEIAEKLRMITSSFSTQDRQILCPAKFQP